MNDLRQELKDPTLCFPDEEKSCFACCPPIRPAGYEHIQHRNIIRRELRENSEAFKRHAEDRIPITGFSCWALGYLDKNHRLIGCLLHPAQNGGVDLRYRTDYGEKCKREFCPEAKAFSGLSLDEKEFWLRLADGLDSFSYSSRRFNPLFKMMDWGGHLLSLIASNENHRTFTRESFFQSYPFFSTNYPPKPNVYMIKWLVNREGTHILENNAFKSKFEVFSGRISKALRQASQKNNPPQPPPFQTHLLDMDRDFLDLLRLSARITKTTEQEALALKNLVDKALEQFRQTLGRM
jgi:hypothetical protein